jgi:hypothetical protein
MRLRRTFAGVKSFVGMKAFVGVRGGVRAGLIVLIAALSTGCSAGGYNAGSLHDRLVRAGLEPAQATCVIDAMVDRFGDNRLNARAEPIAAEVGVERALLRRCGVGAKPRR